MSPNDKNHLEGKPRVKIIDQVEDYSFGGLFRVIKARLMYRRTDGRMSGEITRINFERGDSVGVLLYDPDEDVVVLVRQFRYPVYAGITLDLGDTGEEEQAWLLEVVAGIIEPGSSAVEIASQELLEEAGYMVQADLRPITTIYPSPGGTSERIHLYLGLVTQEDRVGSGGGLPENAEDIQVEYLPFGQAMEMVGKGEISDAKTIIALQHLALLKSRGAEL